MRSSMKILRGRVLTFLRRPSGIEDAGAYRYIEDGGIAIEGSRIVAVDDFDSLSKGAEVIDHRPHLLLPGFIDPHVHFPQVQVLGAYAAELLDWLNDHTFPAEMAYADAEFAARMAVAFFDEMLRNGTTTSVAFCSSHPNSVEAYFAEAENRGVCALGGKVMMDRGAPEGLCDTAQTGYDDSMALAGKWHGRGRAHYVISPRFAITSTEAQLDAAGALAKALPTCLIQTHMNETAAEIAEVARLFPGEDYLGVYDRFGLVTTRTLLGHCIHMDDRQTARMAEVGAIAVHCPTSNLFLGAGMFDKAGLERAGVRTGVASDIGGGTSYSMLRTLDEAYKIAQLRRDRLDPFCSYYWATLGNAAALGLENEIGRFAAGAFGDVVVLNARATAAMALRMETVKDLAQELFVLQTLGDDRAVDAVYVAGEAQEFD